MNLRQRMPQLARWSAVLTLATLAACTKVPQEAAAPAAERVENPELGIAIAALPAMFRVESMESSRIVLKLIEGEGHLEIVAGEPESSINLVAAVKEHEETIKGRPGGDYKGGQELVIPSMPGAAFYSRGRFEREGGIVEETVIFLIHPWEDRQLRAIYTYPAGEDSKERLSDQLFEVVGELEGLPAPGAPDSSSP